MPRFRDARYGDETVRLRDDGIRLDVHRRRDGYGWGELYRPATDGADGFVGVLEHLAEVELARYPRPIHLVADEADVAVDGTAVRFTLHPRELPELEEFREGEDPDPEVTGTLRFSFETTDRIAYDLTLEAREDVELTRLRGPWLRVGADGFGSDRDDAIFPGIEWLTGDEWSSGTDHIEHPNANRVTPHPNKVTIPTMALSRDGIAVAVSWSVERLSDGLGRPQPVFASPNFVDRRNESLLGLMLPGADGALAENELAADEPVPIAAGEELSIAAELSVSEGSSLDAVTGWVAEHGLPELPEPRYDLSTFHDWIAECYATNLWQEDEGFGQDVGMFDGGRPDVPGFVRDYVDREDADPALVEQLAEHIAWCEQHATDDGGTPDFNLASPLDAATSVDDAHASQLGDRLLEIRRDDGAFTYDPDGRHHNFRLDWIEHTRPLGQPGETELGFCVEGGAALLLIGRTTGDDTYTEAGLETLEFALRFEKPAGDDWWETPIHGPNLLAGGKAAVAYALAHQETGAAHYRARARYWLRSLLPFTHLWEHTDLDMVYNTKPCFVASIWTVVSWVNNHVIWEVLAVFRMMDDLEIDWAALDPAIDWDRYQAGITLAVLNWVIDSRAEEEYLDRFQFPDDRMAAGAFDGLYADIHDPLEGTYAGGPIVPDDIARNVEILRERRG